MGKDVSVTARSQSVADLMGKKLGVKGGSLEAKLRRSKHRLPRKVRADAQQLIEAERLLEHPKLAMQAQSIGVDQPHRRCEAWLNSIDLTERRKTFWRNLLAQNAFNLLFVAGLFVVTGRLAGVL